MKTLKLKSLIGLFIIGLTFTAFVSCSAEDVSETEELQIFEEQSTNDRSHKGTVHPSS